MKLNINYRDSCRVCGARNLYLFLDLPNMPMPVGHIHPDSGEKPFLADLRVYWCSVCGVVQTLHDVGLDYVKLGQSATTLSGGEAQRVKLARELGRVSTGRTLYILDEPTTGLHFADIQRLLDVLHMLVDAGNTVVVIEHNLDVIKTADWILDLGPEGGDEGGEIIAQGPPEAVSLAEASYTGQYLQKILQTSP